MYFEPQVKEKKEDFFNYEVLQKELEEALNDKMTPLIAVYGLRRTGKTSLVRVVLNSLKKKYVWIDGRDIQSRRDFEEKLSNKAEKLKKFRIKGIAIKGLEISLRFAKEGFDYLNKHKIILVIDEAQLLKRMGIDNIIAYIFDNYPGIKTILLGSEMGMLKSFLGADNVKAPLYGRAVFDLQTNRLNKENAVQFLIKGAAQIKKQFIDQEINDTVLNLDGIIGWLTKYGWHRKRFNHKDALIKTIEEGKLVAKEEFLRFSSHAENKYWSILKALKTTSKWTKIKNRTKISTKQLYSMLKNMAKHSFIEKREDGYYISDPLLEAAI